MRSDIKCIYQLNGRRMIVAALILATIVLATGCSGAAQPTPTAQIVTVVETVPVEVTRVVEVLNTVEVTRQVVVTVVVEVPVTPEVTPTATRPPGQPAATFSYLPTPTPLVQSFDTPKEQGVSRLKIDNTTDETLTAKASGPQNFEVEIPPGKSAFLNVPYGEYTIRVYEGADRKYTVRVNCINPDKYEIILSGDKASVIEP
jgi:hypothetical protein